MEKDTQVIAIDTETYYDAECSAQTLGSHAYTQHGDFETLLVSAATSSDPKDAIVATPADFPWEVLEGKRIVAHNAGFDRAVLKATPGAPDIPPEAWIDSAGLCAYHQYPRSLKDATAVLFDAEVSKDVRNRMKGKTLEDLAPMELAEFRRYAKEDATWAFRIYEALAPTTPQHELDLMALAMDQGEYGVQIDREALEAGVDRLAAAQLPILEAIPWYPDREADSSIGLADACQGLGIEPPLSTKKDCPELSAWLKANPSARPLVELVQKHRTVNKTLKFLRKMESRLVAGDVLPFEVKYYGSEITGRFSGAGKLNLLNLPKKSVESVSIRPMIRAREGHRLAIVDLSNIEPRVGAWIVGDTDMLDAIRAGADIYEAHARATMGYDDERPLKEVDPEMRNLAKVRVLSLGYQQGAKTLAATKGFDLRVAKQIVHDFRRTSPKLTQRWRMLEFEFKHTLNDDGDYINRLPSGRELRYFDVKREPVTKDGKTEWQNRASMTKGDDARREAFWGGKLYENECQAIARDIFCHGLMAVVQSGHRVLFTVHDELVVEVEEEPAEGDLENIIQLMTTPPEWAKDLPLGADGLISDRYTKG